jgi:hypothetical protein
MRTTMLTEKDKGDSAPLLQQRIHRIAQNAWVRCVGLSVRSDRLLRIKVKELEIRDAKRAFGIRYMDLYCHGDASEQELGECVERAHTKIALLDQKVIELKIAMDRSDEATRTKLLLLGGGSGKSQSSSTTTKNSAVRAPEEKQPLRSTTTAASSSAVAGRSSSSSSSKMDAADNYCVEDDDDDFVDVVAPSAPVAEEDDVDCSSY